MGARYTLLCCGFDSRRHTQILYKENRKMLFGAQKRGKKRIISINISNSSSLQVKRNCRNGNSSSSSGRRGGGCEPVPTCLGEKAKTIAPSTGRSLGGRAETMMIQIELFRGWTAISCWAGWTGVVAALTAATASRAVLLKTRHLCHLCS